VGWPILPEGGGDWMVMQQSEGDGGIGYAFGLLIGVVDGGVWLLHHRGEGDGEVNKHL
jgi:hypothetical protein